MKKVAVIQSNYIPWKGYFDIIHDVDLFIFHDDLQYTKNDWRNRNLAKAPEGTRWLTIPVGTREDRLVCEVQLPEPAWAKKHWGIIENLYSKAPYFGLYKDFLKRVYLDSRWISLSELNQFLIKTISLDFLGIETEFKDSREYGPVGSKLDRLIDLLQKADAGQYVSGPAGKVYIDREKFDAAGIELVFKDYGGYPEYPQSHKPFEHGVSILDLLFHVGPHAPYFIWGWRDGSRGQAQGGLDEDGVFQQVRAS
ncbi:MAG: WbqC family protein [Candidatus Aquicultorales bacterium]